MRIHRISHHFTTQSSHFVDRAGWQAKMASIEFWIPWCNAHGPIDRRPELNKHHFLMTVIKFGSTHVLWLMWTLKMIHFSRPKNWPGTSPFICLVTAVFLTQLSLLSSISRIYFTFSSFFLFFFFWRAPNCWHHSLSARSRLQWSVEAQRWT